jgi:hypothetical protein
MSQEGIWKLELVQRDLQEELAQDSVEDRNDVTGLGTLLIPYMKGSSNAHRKSILL